MTWDELLAELYTGYMGESNPGEFIQMARELGKSNAEIQYALGNYYDSIGRPDPDQTATDMMDIFTPSDQAGLTGTASALQTDTELKDIGARSSDFWRPGSTATAAETFGEGALEQPHGTQFERFLQRQTGGQQLAGPVRSAFERQGRELETWYPYLSQAAAIGTESPQTFSDFLGGRRGALSREELTPLMLQIARTAGRHRDELTDAEGALLGQYEVQSGEASPEQAALQLARNYMETAMPYGMRGGGAAAMTRLFESQRARQPNVPFLKFLEGAGYFGR